MASGWEMYDLHGNIHFYNKTSGRLLRLQLGPEPYKIPYVSAGFNANEITEKNKLCSEDLVNDLLRRGYSLETAPSSTTVSSSSIGVVEPSRTRSELVTTHVGEVERPSADAVIAPDLISLASASIQEPVKPVASSNPVMPVSSAVPSSPASSSKPVASSNPVKPSNPAAPSNPVAPPSPVVSLNPVRPSNPVAPPSPVVREIKPADPVVTPSAPELVIVSQTEPFEAPAQDVSTIPREVVSLSTEPVIVPTPVTLPTEPIQQPLQPSAIVPTETVNPEPMGDYRMRIVSKGTGNPDEWCHRSINVRQSDPVSCTLSHVESPSLFWVRPFTSSLETIEEDLNFDLDNDKKALSNPQVGDYCAAPVEHDDNMHRAKILEFKENNLGTLFAKILYIDSGKVDWVATKALVELPRRYRHYLRQVTPCSLADLVPVSDRWSDDVINSFRELCAPDNGYELYVTGLDEEENPAVNTVTLHRKKNDPNAKEETVLIAVIKEAKRSARRGERTIPATPFGKENGETVIGGLNPPDETDGWRCAVPILAYEEEETEEQLEEQAEERRMQMEALRLSMEPKVIAGELHQISLTDQGVLDSDGNVYFHVGEVISPSNFYVQLVDNNGRNGLLDNLTLAMNSFYSNPSNQLLVPRSAPHQCAAARSTRDGKTSFRRAMIKDWRMPPGMDDKDIRIYSIATVVFVDFGYCQRLQGKDLFVLDKRFCEMPAQAAYCQLHECRPTAPMVDGKWDQNSVDVFKQLVMEGKPLMKGLVLSEKQPFGLVMYRRDPSGEWTCINQRMVESSFAFSDIWLA